MNKNIAFASMFYLNNETKFYLIKQIKAKNETNNNN